MSIIRNRELSQFGSFVYIDNNTQEIGIATDVTPYVGIGTTNPTVKLEVVGDTKINGNLTVKFGVIEASSYNLNGFPLVNPSGQYWSPSATDDIYKLNGNVGIGTSVFTQKLTVRGNVSAGQFISTSTGTTPPFVVTSNAQVTNLNASFLRGKSGPTGDIVGTGDTQTLTNKTLTSPLMSSVRVTSGGIGVTGGISFFGSTSGITTLQSFATGSGVLTLPSATDTLIARNTSDTLTNKTISASSNTITGITSVNLSASAGILNSQLANPTISGVSLGSTLNSLTVGSYLSFNTGTTYNGSGARTISVNASSSNADPTNFPIVARDSNGNFTAGDIECANLTASFSIEAADINSTSDQNLKTNIKTVENSLETINSLRGVSFDWKINDKKSYGVIAQELEKVLPELVKDGDIKSVNYNGIIGILIEAVKELSKEVETLKKKVL